MGRVLKPQKGVEGPSSIRLDLFLKQSRLIPRRILAQQACRHGGIRVNGQLAKAGRVIKSGDLIEWNLPHRRVQVRVLKVPRSVPSKNEASKLFEVI